MANILPTTLFPNYSSDGTSITIPLTDLPALSAAEANATTGDGREVVRALVAKMFSAINALPAADKPTKLTFSQSSPSGVSANVIRQSYTLTVELTVDPSTVSMSSES